MAKVNIIKGNKLIAKFMGVNISDDGAFLFDMNNLFFREHLIQEYGRYWGEVDNEDLSLWGYRVGDYKLEYDWNWNWLIPVITKIRDLISDDENDLQGIYYNMYGIVKNLDITEMWTFVTNYIIWYNSTREHYIDWPKRELK